MMFSRRFILFAGPVAALAGCGGPEPVWAPQEAVDRVMYRHNGPPSLTLFTMRRRSDKPTGTGMHTGLMINASQRVIFDPAGTFGGEGIIERNDLIYGISPLIERYYISYHARETYYVQIQTAEVPLAVAEKAFTLARDNGAVAKTQCAVVTGGILRQLEGFEFIETGLWPGDLAEQFGQYPGVTSRTYFENDSDDKEQARAAFDAQVRGVKAVDASDAEGPALGEPAPTAELLIQ